MPTAVEYAVMYGPSAKSDNRGGGLDSDGELVQAGTEANVGMEEVEIVFEMIDRHGDEPESTSYNIPLEEATVSSIRQEQLNNQADSDISVWIGNVNTDYIDDPSESDLDLFS